VSAAFTRIYTDVLNRPGNRREESLGLRTDGNAERSTSNAQRRTQNYAVAIPIMRGACAAQSRDQEIAATAKSDYPKRPVM
jgi:hypothetical protein